MSTRKTLRRGPGTWCTPDARELMPELSTQVVRGSFVYLASVVLTMTLPGEAGAGDLWQETLARAATSRGSMGAREEFQAWVLAWLPAVCGWEHQVSPLSLSSLTGGIGACFGGPSALGG